MDFVHKLKTLLFILCVSLSPGGFAVCSKVSCACDFVHWTFDLTTGKHHLVSL